MASSEPSSHLVGLIGADIGPSLSPALHEREADRLGLRYVYRRIDITTLALAPEAVGELVAAAGRLGFDGLNITHPCKQLVVEHLDSLSADAAALGAVNTVVFDDGRAIGHNTDWPGFQASFARGLPDVDTDRVVLVGAGGAGAAVAHASLSLGVRRLAVADAAPERADALVASLRARYGGEHAVALALDDLPDELAGADGIVNATPAGMQAHDEAAFSPELLHAGLWVADVVYRPLETELLRQRAAARLPDPRRRRHGGLPGRARLLAVHGTRARPRADAVPLRHAGRRLRGRSHGDRDRHRVPQRDARGQADRRVARRVRRRRAVRERPHRLAAVARRGPHAGRRAGPGHRPLPALPRLRGGAGRPARAQPAPRRGEVRRDGGSSAPI